MKCCLNKFTDFWGFHHTLNVHFLLVQSWSLFVSVSTVNMSGLLPHGKETAGDNSTPFGHFIVPAPWKISSVLVTEKASTSAKLHSKMLFDRRSLQVAVQTHSCVCAGRLWTSRASCLRFQWVKRHSCRHYPPKTTALLHKQRPCCVWKDYRYTAPPWRRLGWAVTHCFMQHSRLLMPLCPITKGSQEARPPFLSPFITIFYTLLTAGGLTA